MIYCFDLDGTLCTNTFGEYELAQPFLQRISKVNELFNEGHKIKIFTARGSGTGINWQQLTKNQLLEWGVNYNELILGKPEADLYIDDRAISDLLFFGDLL